MNDETKREELPGWAEEEVRLACEKEAAANSDPKDVEYAEKCYQSALRAFQSLDKDGHDSASLQVTKGILNRLIDGRPLTPITDDPGVWLDISGEGVCDWKNGEQLYQCSRMATLFKTIKPDGTVIFSDVSRVNCMDVDKPGVFYQNGLATRLIDAAFPITMPYFPAAKKVTVVRDVFLSNPKHQDYDTVAFLYLITPEGKKVDLNRYFKTEGGKLVPIELGEFEKRKALKVT